MPSSSGSTVLHQFVPSRRLYTSLVVMAFNLSQLLRLVSGTRYCENTTDCVDSGYIPYICQDGRCVCNPERGAGVVSCIPARIYGDKCRTDEDCHTGDVNLICARIDSSSRTCRCRKGYVWDMESKRCYRIDDDTYRHSTHKFDPVRDLIIPGIIVMTIGAMMYLGIKLFCSCGKLWQRGSHNETPREMEECVQNSHNTWVASYRVFSSLERSPTSQFSGPGGNLHPAPCLLVPGPATTMSPPPYEEALKHKILLSSYPVSLAAVCPPPPPLPMVLPPLPPPHHEAILHPVPSSSTATNQGSGS